MKVESGLMDGYGGHVENDLQILFSGKKKSKKKCSHGLASARGEDDLWKNINEEADPDNICHDKNADLDGDVKIETESGLMDEYDQRVEDDLQIVFSGKKKSKKKSSRGLTSTWGEDDLLKNKDEEAEDPDNIGQDKNFDNFRADAQNTAIGEPSKNKKKKKKDGKTAQDDDLDKILEELGEGPSKSSFSALQEDVEQNVLLQSVSVNDEQQKEKEVGMESAAASKKKKKKGGKTAQDDDLDKILAELGEGPSKSTPAPLQKGVIESVSINDEEEKEKEVGIESAAAKKKKKKKEKEKEKKAAAAAAPVSATTSEGKEEGQQPIETKNEIRSKGGDKKLSKGGKGIQQLIAKRREAEEKQKKEEEERLRKEEEERLRKEELERQAEEAKHRKKEREKEKLKMKKLEGKLLTDKQKEEARRLEAMRNQFLSNAGGLSLPNLGAPAKRPIYQTKKSKASPALSNGNIIAEASVSVDEETTLQKTSHLDSFETEKFEESVSVGDGKPEAGEIDEKEIEAEAEEEENDDDWDAKSWDDAVLTLPVKSAFADEDSDLKQELTKKEREITKVPVTDLESSNSAAIKDIPPHRDHRNTSSLEKSSSYELHGKSDTAEVDKCETVEPLTPDSSDENLRSPICCIMGHVDTGKTKLLDCIRGTNVQEGEAGGITQQIGATYFPAENIRERTKELKEDAKLKVPGLLVIDTPGHESFTNLRSRGSGLCDIAILVVDIMHGLEPQTVESINLLRMRSTEFIVALNKVDRLYGWKVCRNAPIMKALKQQSKEVKSEFEGRLSEIIFQFKEQGLNTQLYYKNKDHGDTYNIVPTSAISGEGIPDLLLWLVQWTQKTMVEKLTFSNEVQCTVLEVKVIEGHGTTIDVVLVNGVLHEGDQIVVCGMQGPIVATIRALLTPHPMKELRVKGTYLHHREIKAAQGIKISAQGLEHAVAGTGLYVVSPGDDIEVVKETAMEDMRSVMSRIDKSGEGVYVQASTIGSLEALLEFLKSPAVKIPVSGIGIGPVHKKDVMKASVMLEKKKEFATILAFDVKVTPEARELADEQGVRIFCADIIYHLFDQFKAYMENLKEEKRREAADEAVFPCVLKIMPNCIFNKKDPIVLGVDVLEGIAKVGTPICIPQRDFVDIGRISSIENNHKPVDVAPKGQKVAIKIVGSTADEQQKMFGRHFELEDMLVSHLTRRSIDVLKENYRNDLSKDDWQLVAKLKRLLNIT